MTTLKEYKESLRTPTWGECAQSQSLEYIEMLDNLVKFAFKTQIPSAMAWSIRICVSRSMREGTDPNEFLKSSKLWRDSSDWVASYNGSFSLTKQGD